MVERVAVADALVIIVHYGETEPSLVLANALCRFTENVTVVANNNDVAPADLDTRVQWLPAGANRGYAGAVMHALGRLPRRDYVVVLNNDIVLPEQTFRHALDDLRSDPGLGLVGPVLRYADGSLQSGVGRTHGLLRWDRFDNDPHGELVECDWVMGAVMFVRTQALESCGWDTSYFLGFEELDLCRRLRTGGYRIACDGRVSATHHSGSVIGGHWSYYFIRNRLWFSRKHYPRWRTSLIAASAVYIGAKSVLGDIRHRRRFAQSTLFLNGIVDGLRPGLADRDEPLPDEPRAVVIADRRALRTEARAVRRATRR